MYVIISWNLQMRVSIYSSFFFYIRNELRPWHSYFQLRLIFTLVFYIVLYNCSTFCTSLRSLFSLLLVIIQKSWLSTVHAPVLSTNALDLKHNTHIYTTFVLSIATWCKIFISVWLVTCLMWTIVYSWCVKLYNQIKIHFDRQFFF